MSKGRRMLKLEIRALVPNRISPERFAKLADKMLDIGYADAQETLQEAEKNQEAESEDAKDVTEIVWCGPTVKEEQ